MLRAKTIDAGNESGHQMNPPKALSATETLWRVAESDDPSQMESLLQHGAEINASNENGTTALMRAACYGRTQMVRALLEQGADPNLSRNDKFTPLLLAAFFGHGEVVRALVEYGADPQAASCSDTSAQMWASRRIFHDVVHYLKYEGTPPELRKEPIREPGSSQAPAEEKVVQKTVDAIISSTTSAMTLENSVKEEQGFEVVPVSGTSAVKRPHARARRKKRFKDFVLRPPFVSRFLDSNEIRVAYSLGALLFVVALIGGLTSLSNLRSGKVSSKPNTTFGVNESDVRTSAIQNFSEANTPNSQVGSLGLSDLKDRSKTPEKVIGETKPKSPHFHRIVASTTDSRRVEPSQVQDQVTMPTIAADSKVVRAPELPSVETAATAKVSDAKPPPVSKSAIQRSAPASQSTQLMSPSKSSPPQGRTILWP